MLEGSPALCAHLRWKSYYGAEHLDARALLALAQRGDVPFHCLQTCRPWGPDDGPAAPEACSDRRRCWVPSPRSGEVLEDLPPA